MKTMKFTTSNRNKINKRKRINIIDSIIYQ